MPYPTPTAYYTFDNNSVPPYTDSMGGESLILKHGVAASASGKIGKGVVLDGEARDMLAATTVPLDPAVDFYMSFWLKSSILVPGIFLGDYVRLVAVGGAHYLSIYGLSPDLFFYLQTPEGISQIALEGLPIGEFVMIHVAFRSSDKKLLATFNAHGWLSGDSIPTMSQWPATSLKVGASADDTDTYILGPADGAVDELMIVSGSIPDDESRVLLYNGGEGVTYPFPSSGSGSLSHIVTSCPRPEGYGIFSPMIFS